MEGGGEQMASAGLSYLASGGRTIRRCANPHSKISLSHNCSHNVKNFFLNLLQRFLPLAGLGSVVNVTISQANRRLPLGSEENRISPPPLKAGKEPSESNISEGKVASVNSTGKSVKVPGT